MGNIECCKKPREDNIDAEIIAQKADANIVDIQPLEEKLKCSQPQENEEQQEYQVEETFKPQDSNQKSEHNEDNMYLRSENIESKGIEQNPQQIYESFKQTGEQDQGAYDIPYDNLKESAQAQNFPDYTAQVQSQPAQNAEIYQSYQVQQPQEQIQYQQQESQVAYPVEKLQANYTQQQAVQASYFQQPETQGSCIEPQNDLAGFPQPAEQVIENFDPNQIQTRIIGTKQLTMDQVPKEIREKLFSGKAVTVEQHNATTASNCSMPQYLPAESPMQHYDFNLTNFQKTYKVKDDQLPPEIMAHIQKTIENYENAPQTQSINLAAKQIPGASGLEMSNCFPSVVMPQSDYTKFIATSQIQPTELTNAGEITFAQSYALNNSDIQYNFPSSKINQYKLA